MIILNRYMIGLYCIFLGIGLVICGGIGIYDSLKTPLDYNSVSESQIKENVMIEGDIKYNLGSYLSYDGGANYFAIPVGENSYIGYHINNKKSLSLLTKQSEETSQFFKDSKKAPQSIHFKGKVVKMKAEESEAIDSFFKNMDNNSDVKYFDNYVINNFKDSNMYILSASGIVVLIIGIILEVLEYRKKHMF